MTEASDKQTPPPLHYSPSLGDHDHSSTRESTPIGTPVAANLPFPRRPDRGKDFASWFSSKPTSGPRASYFDSAIIDSDLEEDANFPLFPSSPPVPSAMMNGQSAPLDISARQTSVSPPGHQASNLTSALQRAAYNDRSGSISNAHGTSTGALKASAARKDSLSASMAQWGNGTKPISVMGSNRDKPRRESLAGSLVGGMSWGGVSVGSWIRDDIIMAGTSPFAIQSPSYHSSSYLPKLEANFMRDFSCCGVTLPTLHDLLQHYEEAHAQKAPQSGQRTSQADSRAALAVAAATSAQQQNQPGNTTQAQSERQPTTQPSFIQHQLAPQQSHIDTSAFGAGQTNLDLDTIDDMEMDDAMGLSDTTSAQLFGSNSRDQMSTGFTPEGNRVTPLNLGMLQGQGLRNSQPGTPVTATHTMLQNNPTVSSVNTPTLMSNPLQNAQYRATPDSSAPGTPAELDESVMSGFGDLSMQGNMGHPPSFNVLTGNNDMVDLCIDEPAKRLYSPNGGFGGNSSQAHMKLGNSQYTANSDVARRIREQQLLAGVPDTSAGMMTHEEPKPFRCPVIGCEKAYKNQNGLKYHKTHGHNNQQLHDNADGTFSIVNPETSAPYPGTLGMEKEKPYRCEVCGKRYKNLNGLKYHKSHSPPCNPDLQLGAGRNLNLGGVMQGQNINVAGAGLPGIGEEGLM